jgi:hypothetical protein
LAKAKIFYCLILQLKLEAIQNVTIAGFTEMMKREVCARSAKEETQ